MSREVVILNEFGAASLQRRRRTLKSGKLGKAYNTIDTKSEPIIGVFDDLAMGAGPAERYQEIVKEQISDISESISPSTKAYREKAEKAYDSGAGWAKKRYKKHRPNSVGRDVKFNDSNRLRDSIRARQSTNSKSFSINMASDRMIDYTAHLAAQFVDLVPALKNPASIKSDREFNKEIERSMKLMIAKARDIKDMRRVQLRQTQLNAVKAAFGLIRSLGGL